jgi:hypothetical protein
MRRWPRRARLLSPTGLTGGIDAAETHLSGAARTHSVTIEDGAYDRVVPGPGQCFVDLDVTQSHYRTYGRAQRSTPPTIVGRHFDGEPFDVNRTHYYAEHMLPDDISQSRHVFLVQEAPCALAEASDAEVLDAAGYGAPAPAPTYPRRR